MASILVVDDDDDLRDMIADVLAAEGHRVRECRNGEEALAALDDAYPQLVVSDVEMPVLDGPSLVYRMFVENLGRENIPVIIVSGNADVTTIAERVGTPYYLAKPFTRSSLNALVRRALHEGRPPRPPTR